MVEQTLKKLGFTDDAVNVYFDLLENSPTSVRAIASRTGVGRGTVFNYLKKFITDGIASHYQRGGLKMFAAQEPASLQKLLRRQERELAEQKEELSSVLPELRSFYSNGGERPKVRYFEGTKEVSQMLRDVLDTMSGQKKKEYYVYSTKGKRQIIYTDFPDFSEKRIRQGIKVKVIAIGKGGELRGLDERRWLSQKETENSSYMVVYGNKI